MSNAGTNASPVHAALHLSNADIKGNLQNRFLSVAVQKAGVLRGPKNAKVRMGDDKVAAVILGGVNYGNLKQRDLDKLNAALAEDATLFTTFEARAANEGIFAWSGRGKNATQDVAIGSAMFEAAFNEIVESCEKTLAGTNESTSAHVYEGLEVDGHKVHGCKVYVGDGGADAGEDKRTPEVGSIHISGLAIASRVIEAAQHAKPKSKSGAKALAKRLITKWLALPSRKWVQYRIPASEQWRLKVGGQAALAMTEHGLEITARDAEEVLTAANLTPAAKTA
ncbi:MAG: hypothetical protein VXX11_03665 [Planctomycetota bacterium]|nr:hypothetical protein [Planctomycetota bacterium]